MKLVLKNDLDKKQPPEPELVFEMRNQDGLLGVFVQTPTRHWFLVGFEEKDGKLVQIRGASIDDPLIETEPMHGTVMDA